MLKPTELAAKSLISADEHKRTANTLRRLAGGLNAQRGNALELNDKEKGVLAEAIQLLERMAETTVQASKITKKRWDAEQTCREEIRAALRPTFGGLSTVTDKVALIGAVQSYSLKNNSEDWATNKHMLDEVFRSAIEDLPWRLARASDSRPAAEIAAEAWAKFQEGRADIEQQHASLIVALQRLHSGATA